MRKFKLIKEYPGSPELNTIVKKEKSNNSQYFFEQYYYKDKNNIGYGISIDMIENYSEFWQEVIENDYEILSFRSKVDPTSIWTLRNNGYYRRDTMTKDWAKESFLKNNVEEIYSVKRLSDGEIFTIGDKVMFSAKSGCTLKGPITSFGIDSDYGIVVNYTDKSKGYGHHSNYLHNAEKPLFVTEDGIGVYENNNIYVVRPNFTIWYTTVKTNILNFINEYKIFSTEKSAEEYIIRNKPCLSLNDILINATNDSNDKIEISFDYFKELVKTKLNL